MKHFFYPRLALSNIKKHAQIYFPYLITSIMTVMMFYLIYSLAYNSGFDNHETTRFVLILGAWVVIIFSIIFLLYMNSFLIKRRKKEIALYNILGMEKKHVMLMMFYETLMTTVISIVGGILFGIIFNRLMFMVLIYRIHLSTDVVLEISVSSMIMTLMVYIPIFLVSYLFNVIQIHINNPIELLKGGNIGEKEPKTKWLITIIGILTLGGGYYIAQTIENPIAAFSLFFVAVILVIIGTYCLLTSGSIALLKLLKKNNRLYYRTRYFTSLSTMIYRMKQNAVGLASICILCTCILVMMSSTVSLYLGIEDSVNMMQNEQMKIRIYSYDEETSSIRNDKIKSIENDILKQLKDENIDIQTYVAHNVYDYTIYEKGNQYFTGYDENTDSINLIAMTLNDYNQAYHLNASLLENEVLIACNYKNITHQWKINNHSFHIQQIIDDTYILNNKDIHNQSIAVVFKDQKTLYETLSIDSLRTIPYYSISIDFKDSSSQDQAMTVIENSVLQNSEISMMINSQNEIRDILYESYGSLLFLGIFLGILFMIATVLIMYYKQLSEGYEDQKRFEIMQNVGMSKKEVKQTIQSQVLIFFFLPIVMAIIHMIFAFKMIVEIFSYMLLSSKSMFVVCTIGSIIIMVVVYSIVYFLTARTYYRIVKN